MLVYLLNKILAEIAIKIDFSQIKVFFQISFFYSNQKILYRVRNQIKSSGFCNNKTVKCLEEKNYFPGSIFFKLRSVSRGISSLNKF